MQTFAFAFCAMITPSPCHRYPPDSFVALNESVRASNVALSLVAGGWISSPRDDTPDLDLAIERWKRNGDGR